MDNSRVELVFPAVEGRDVVCSFDGGDITSDAGLVLVSEADRKMGLSEEIAGAIRDGRQQSKVEHGILEMVRERVYAIAAGYEDANDLDTLGDDPVLKMVCGRLPESPQSLASQPTISRLENSVGRVDLLRMGVGIAHRVIQGLPSGTRKVVLDVDATDDPCHGQQEFEFFNGYYDEHCYVPLYIHVTGNDGRQRLLGALLRPGNASSTKGLYGLLRIAIRLIRARFPDIEIVVRADSGFGVGDVIEFCEGMGVDFVLGLRGNKRLHTLSTPVQMDACLKHKWEGDGCREYGKFEYKAGPWARSRRVIAKAEITRGELNPRFVVTSLTEATPEAVYEFYCARGDQENRIKEMKLDLSSGRTSCHRFLANQFRLLLVAGACALMGAISEALKGTRWAGAQVETIRVRLLKVGARVVQSCRKIWVHLPTSFPERSVWRLLHQRLAAGTRGRTR